METSINQYGFKKSCLKAERELLSEYINNGLPEDRAERRYRAIYKMRRDDPVVLGDKDRIREIAGDLREINRSIRHLKEELTLHLANHNGTRELREDCVRDRDGKIASKNVISVFDSMLTRTLGMKVGTLCDDFMVIRTYYFDVIRDMIVNGFTYQGNKYVCFTASAGQIRTKKTVFIREDVWMRHQKTLMCGLTVDSINEHGGININKYLAYLALCNSATDPWDDFDITKSIVVDDMETMVRGVVDFIDHKTYQTTRREMDIPITHTDGCGMVLPSCCGKNTMIRLPWVKGLLAVFPFDRFIREADDRDPSIRHGLVKDIYGEEHDILAEGIHVIFTKSQFKMHKYYANWQEYIRMYLENGCSAGKCNEEEDYLPDAKLNYQMLQTLTNMTEQEVASLAERSVEKINRIAADRDTMLDVFGATSQFRDKNAFQECLQVYPELLSDPYTKEILRQIKKNLVKEAKAAKLDISAKYMFLIPDLYAFCEWLFLGIRNPVGLLQNGEVSSYLYRKVEKLDCLRSPHLYREHAVRRNVVSTATRKWFTPNALYTSCSDLISKILMFDNDGDKALVCADPLLVEIAERNMEGIVPLYYDMAKAGAVMISPQEIFNGLRAAWTGGNIGVISNDITKIWNSAEPDINLVKILCMENNYVIDYAKTLYKPTRPEDLDARLTSITGSKAPHFFIYAKNKSADRVQKLNHSVINQLETIIPNRRMSFTVRNIGAFRYEYLLSDPNAYVEIDQGVVDLYDEVEKEYRYSISFYEDETNCAYLRDCVLERFGLLGIPMERVCDVLVKQLFHQQQSKRKAVFWMCFGDIVLRNLQRNVPEGSIQCRKCGERFIPTSPQNKVCSKCDSHTRRGRKKVVCVDCGHTFDVDARNMKKVRCDACQKQYRLLYDAAKHREYRNQTA